MANAGDGMFASPAAKCFGVYREDSRKTWLVHRTSRFDKHGIRIFV